MQNIHRNENNFQNNRKFTELPITIVTDDEYKVGDNLEMVRQRIEKAALYVHSLFNIIRYSLENLPSFDDRKIEETIWDARSVCEIGYGVADSILASASGLTEFQPDDASEVEAKPNTNDIALSISDLLNNPDLPEPIQRGIDRVMTDFFNGQLDSGEFNDDTHSPEYIARHLKVFEAGKKEARDDR